MLQGIKNAGSLVSNANKVRQQQAKLQKILQEIRVTGTSKNGKVTVVITGEQKIIDIKIDPSIIKFVYENFFTINLDDAAKSADNQNRGQKFLSSPIIEAVDDAISKVQGEVVKKIQETGSLGDLMSMLQAAGGQQ
ncbi:MAG: YbaB/EbfC family nucleoid-associated protein [bacterium]